MLTVSALTGDDRITFDEAFPFKAFNPHPHGIAREMYPRRQLSVRDSGVSLLTHSRSSSYDRTSHTFVLPASRSLAVTACAAIVQLKLENRNWGRRSVASPIEPTGYQASHKGYQHLTQR
jgi:hypothetical protein